VSLAGPLLGLSFRRAGHHCGPKHTPQPPTNEDRRRALLQVWPMERHNQFNWQQSAANPFEPNPPSDEEIREAGEFKYGPLRVA
jgi:hypothetical protein